MHGPEGVRFCSRLKTITTRWPTGMRGGADFIMPTMKQGTLLPGPGSAILQACN